MEFALPRRLPCAALPRRAFRAVRITLRAVQSVPRLSAVIAELRDAVQQIERLATFAAQELPEVIYQLEAMREQLAAIERRLGSATAPQPSENGVPSRDELRSGSRRP